MSEPFDFYVINVKAQESRRISSERELGRIGKVPIFVSAVTPLEVPSADCKFVPKGVRAVWLSHMKALEKFLKTESCFAVIAEDDFSILNARILQTHLKSLSKSNFDYVQLGFLKPGVDTKISIATSNIQQTFFKLLAFLSRLPMLKRFTFGNRLRVREARGLPSSLVMYDSQPGAHFYLVSRRFAEEVRSLNTPQFLSIDDFFTSLARMRCFKMARMKNSLVSQKNFPSWEGDRFIRKAAEAN